MSKKLSGMDFIEILTTMNSEKRITHEEVIAFTNLIANNSFLNEKVEWLEAKLKESK